MKKIYVLDTNVLLDNPDAVIESFEENDVVLPLTVIEELDNLKKTIGDIGFCARQALRNIESCRKDGDVVMGVERNAEGGMLRVIPFSQDDNVLFKEKGLHAQKPDDYIVLTALKIKEQGETPTIFISNDTSARIKCSLLGVPAQFYKDGSVSKEALTYSGYRNIDVPIEFFGDIIDGVFSAKRLQLKIDIEELQQYVDVIDVVPNEFLLLSPKDEEGILDKKQIKKLKVVYRYVDDKISPKLVRKNLSYKTIYGNISGKNLEQSVALDVLLDDSVKVVALTGPAGSGKTLLSTATCLTKMLKEKDTNYEKLILLKPTIAVGDDIGFLPGSIDEKLSHYMGSYADNFKTLRKLESVATNISSKADTLDTLKSDGKVEVESISYIRGRSLSDCLIIVDEVQNIPQIVIKTILTRVGENCKIILLGDPSQIDRACLSKYNNGLSYAIEKLRGQSFFAHVKFIHGVRSEVSKCAADLL